MIRDLTLAYVTAMINNYEVSINKVITETAVTRTLKNVVANLGSLTDFVMDLKEDVQADKDIDKLSQIMETCFSLKNENDKLLERIKNLSSSYEYANHGRNKAIGEAMDLRRARDADYKTIEELNQQINKFKCSDLMWTEIYRQNLERIKKLTGI